MALQLALFELTRAFVGIHLLHCPSFFNAEFLECVRNPFTIFVTVVTLVMISGVLILHIIFAAADRELVRLSLLVCEVQG
jgi:fumarate reductase subunit C